MVRRLLLRDIGRVVVRLARLGRLGDAARMARIAARVAALPP